MAQGQPQLDLVTTAQPRRQAGATVSSRLVLGILQPGGNAVCSLILWVLNCSQTHEHTEVLHHGMLLLQSPHLCPFKSGMSLL